MLAWIIQIGLFVAIFAVPCLLFWASDLLARELRDFFESSALAIAIHALLTVLITLGVLRLVNSLFTPEQFLQFSLFIRLGVMVMVTAWVFGASGALYDDQAPRRRISARGLKRYR